MVNSCSLHMAELIVQQLFLLSQCDYRKNEVLFSIQALTRKVSELARGGRLTSSTEQTCQTEPCTVADTAGCVCRLLHMDIVCITTIEK